MKKVKISPLKGYARILVTSTVLAVSLTGCGALERLSQKLPSLDDNYTYPEEANNIPVDSWASPPQTQTSHNGAADMAQPQGLKMNSVAQSMDEPLGTEEIYARFQFMEQQIGLMRQDMERIAPLLGRLSVMEESIRELSHALNAAYQQPSNSAVPAAPATTMMAPAMPAANTPPPHMAPYGQPMPTQILPQGTAPAMMNHNAMAHNNYTAPQTQQAAPTQPKQVAAPKMAAGTNVTGIRFGKYKGRDRVVLDLTSAADFRYDLDNNEKILIVDLPNAAWSAQMAKKISSSDAISAYNAQPGQNGGTQLVFSLKRNARISQARPLPPNQKYGHRIFMDIE